MWFTGEAVVVRASGLPAHLVEGGEQHQPLVRRQLAQRSPDRQAPQTGPSHIMHSYWTKAGLEPSPNLIMSECLSPWTPMVGRGQRQTRPAMVLRRVTCYVP